MKAISVNIMLYLLMLFNSFGSFEASEENTCVELSELQETVDLPLSKILDDILSDTHAYGQVNKSIYVFGISKINQGIRVDVHKEVDGKINDGLTPMGYVPYRNAMIIVVADNWLIDEGLICRPERADKIAVMVESRHPGVIYDPDSWTYWINAGNYARHVNGIGWVWTL
ncbi:MAG: hypothetical protein K2L22_03640, partial [Muribaculaceae bacterium]|nr:hypothetical protein [Muribaculaceae bacterium]